MAARDRNVRTAAGTDADVLVVGAGIAGLSVAACLHRLGVGVEIAEEAPGLRAAGAGITLHPNALALMPELAQSLRAEGASIRRQVSIDPGGATTVVDWARVWGGELPVAIHRRRLAELMVGRVPEAGIRWATAVEAVEDDGEAVRVRFRGGEVGRYAVVVGADGTFSRVRAAVDRSVEPQYLGQMYWRTTVPRRTPFDVPDWHVWRRNRHFFGVMPIARDRAHVFLQASVPTPAHVPPEQARTRMAELARSIGDHAAALVDSLELDDELHVRPALGLRVDRWTSGRVALAGDAAHSVSPATTQGGALAIEDAVVLAEEVDRHGLGRAALAAYEQRRRRRIARFLRVARLHVRLMEAVQDAAPASARRRAGAGRERESTRWFRGLYEPLMEPA